jgi:hypothetical protein
VLLGKGGKEIGEGEGRGGYSRKTGIKDLKEEGLLGMNS